MKAGIVLLAVVAVLALAAPAAAGPQEPVGERICLHPLCEGGDNQTFPENAPFYIQHGWVLSPQEQAPIGLWSFALAVDGVLVPEDFVERGFAAPATPPQLKRLWVFNFPQGMTGEHAFTARWLGPCQELVEAGTIPGPCARPMEVVTAAERTVHVTFVR